MGFECSPASSRRGLDDAAEVGFVVGAAGAAGDNLKRDEGKAWLVPDGALIHCVLYGEPPYARYVMRLYLLCSSVSAIRRHALPCALLRLGCEQNIIV